MQLFAIPIASYVRYLIIQCLRSIGRVEPYIVQELELGFHAVDIPCEKSLSTRLQLMACDMDINPESDLDPVTEPPQLL